MAAKSKREQIKMVSTEGEGKDKHYYTTNKNKTNTPKKLELKKYHPKLKKHVIYKEEKL